MTIILPQIPRNLYVFLWVFLVLNHFLIYFWLTCGTFFLNFSKCCISKWFDFLFFLHELKCFVLLLKCFWNGFYSPALRVKFWRFYNFFGYKIVDVTWKLCYSVFHQWRIVNKKIFRKLITKIQKESPTIELEMYYRVIWNQKDLRINI